MSRSSDPIARLWEWFIGAILVLALLPVGFAVLLSLLREAFRAVGLSVVQLLPGALGGLVVAIALGLFLAGLAVRLREGRGGPSGVRERAAANNRTRLAVRRAAEDAPVHESPTSPEDPDPAINDLGGE
jgi:hypothetical protein